MLGAHVSDPLGWAVGNSDADRGEARRETPFCAATPTDRSPGGHLQHCLRGDRLHVGDMPLAGAPASSDREDHRYLGWIYFLLERDPDCPGKPTLTQTLPERALKPYPASASTQPKRAPAARTRSTSASAISGLVM